MSNGFAKREFGQPLIADFFPTVDLQKVVDCSGLLFPGHGTPTCLVFGAQRQAKEELPIRIAAILPGGGDLRTQPEESPLWHTLEKQHDRPGFENEFVLVSDRDRKNMAKWPWSFDGRLEDTKRIIDSAGVSPLRDFLAEDVGFDVIFGARELFDNPSTLWRRLGIPPANLIRFSEGEMLRNYTADEEAVCLFPYDEKLKPYLPKKILSAT